MAVCLFISIDSNYHKLIKFHWLLSPRSELRTSNNSHANCLENLHVQFRVTKRYAYFIRRGGGGCFNEQGERRIGHGLDAHSRKNCPGLPPKQTSNSQNSHFRAMSASMFHCFYFLMIM